MTIEKTPESDTLVADALVEIVGRQTPGEFPSSQRVKGMLADLLGPDGRTQLSETTAVVEAAALGVPEAIAGGATDDDLVDSLSATLDADTALYAIRVWRYALDGAPANELPPTLSTPQPEPEPVGATVLPPTPAVAAGAAATSLPGYTPPTELPDDPEPREPRVSRQQWAVAAVVVLLLGGLVGIGAWAFGGDDTDDVADETSDDAPDDTDDVVTVAETGAVTLTFDPETNATFTAGREWTADDGELLARISLTNTTNAPQKIRHVEIIPKTIAETVDDLTFVPEPEIIEEDPVVAFNITLDAKQATTVTYTAAVADDLDADGLAALKTDWETARDTYVAENFPPELAITAPSNGETVTEPQVGVGGTTTPGATVAVNGVAAGVADDGKWIVNLGGLTDGDNTITATATSPNGTTATRTLTITYTPPDTTGNTTTTTTPPCRNCRGTTTTTTVNPPPPPPPPPVDNDTDKDGIVNASDRCSSIKGIAAHGGCPAPSVSISGPRAVYTEYSSGCDNYSYTVNISANGWTPSVSSYRWWHGSQTYTGGKTASNFTFNNTGGFGLNVTVVIDGVSYDASVSITAYDHNPGTPVTSCFP